MLTFARRAPVPPRLGRMTPEPRSTPRQRARAALVGEIKDSALRQIAEHGAQHLSLRAITREVGMVSSGIYRYFASRDELLTALIVDAYTDLAATLESASSADASPRQQWIETCTALRTFARREPHRFSLAYGTPISGYRAPADTVAPAAGVARALAGPVMGATDADAPRSDEPDPAGRLGTQLATMAEALGTSLPATTLAHTVGAIAQLVGLLTLELGGHFVGTFEPADDLYDNAVAHLADELGLA